MDKRTLIAVVLAVFVLLAYQYLFVTPPPQQQATDTKPPQETPKVQPSPGIPAAPVQTTAGQADQTAQEREVRVETESYTALLTSHGGAIKKFALKQYKDKDGSYVSLLNPGGVYPALAMGLQDDFGLSKINFTVKGNELMLKGSQTGSLTFEYTTQQYSVKRTYTFYADRYKIDLREEVSGVPDYWITIGSDFGIHSASDDSAPHIGPVILQGTDRIELTAKNLAEPKLYRDGIHWIAQEDKYFFSSLVPAQPTPEAKAWKIKDSTIVALKVASGVNNFIVYAGPKEYDRLKELGFGLEHIIDFGFFSILARPLFWILKFFHRFIGNYGWAIVLLTIVTRVPFIPLIEKSQKSMKRMQELQPKFAELREKHKNDPQRLQKEMVEMYKKYKVNPVGGCLPMLLQIPVFFALYKVLMIAIELRGAPFVFWVTDLSLKDPYYILPIVMGITMVIQQKMTPTTVDPKQAKIMMFMPVIFTFMFLNFASGLVLYWLVNNILSIAQQYYTNLKVSRKAENS